jgi:proteasome lid subunit RPN8/RPN11
MKIKREIIQKIIKHAQNELPIEACGYLAGKDGLISHAYKLTNIDNSPKHFSFDPEEQFKVMKKTRAEQIEIIANYHSHPLSPARPSEEDIRLAFDPNIKYFIVSLVEPIPKVRAYSIINGEVKEIDLEII